MRAIFSGFSNRGSRAGAALRPLNPRPEPFVVGIEEEKKIFAVGLVARLKVLQDSFEEPGRVADVPARRRHELGGLNYVVFDFQRRNYFQSARADGLIQTLN